MEGFSVDFKERDFFHLDLGKAVGKVDRQRAKDVVGLYRTLSASMEKYKELLSREIMDKLQ